MNTTKNLAMINYFGNWRATGLALAVVSALSLTSCSQPPPPLAAPVAPSTPPTGRYQIATASDGERGTTLVLLDTTTGETWLFHAPTGPLYNGFWGDVPRVTSPGETWRQAFQTLVQTPQLVPPLTNRPATATNPPAK